MKVALATIMVFGCLTSTVSACGGVFDVSCNIGKSIEKAIHDSGNLVTRPLGPPGPPPIPVPGLPGSLPGILHPVREYLRETEIPPAGVAAYGMVVLKSKPTAANSNKLHMVCNSFIAHFDRAEMSPYPASDQMVTIWPLSDPDNSQAKADNCDWTLQNYVLGAASTAMGYAAKQHMTFDGEGPYLIGWSPASSRDEPDKLVLVVDMSKSNDQASIDHDFDFWKDKIVKDPASWRSGFSLEAMRQKIKDFVDHYGNDVVDDIKMYGL